MDKVALVSRVGLVGALQAGAFDASGQSGPVITKVSELENDKGYITQADVSGVTKTSQLINDKGYATLADVSAVVPASTNNTFVMLYPNGTEANPATLTKGQRIEVPSPFPAGSQFWPILELKINGKWSEPGYIYASGGYGCLARQLEDLVVVMSGSAAIATTPFNTLNANTTYSGNLDNLPYRVKVIRLS